MSFSSKVARRFGMKRSKSIASRAASTAVTPYSVPQSELTDKWLSRLRLGSRGATAIDKFEQLSALVDFFNRNTVNHGLDSIDWKKWEDDIHTPDVVSRIKAKYEHFMKSEYEVSDGASRVNTKTDKLSALDLAVTYNYAVWMCHYVEHVTFMEGLTNLGDITDMSTKEILRHSPQIDLMNMMNFEIGDISSQDYIENGIATRIVTQFSWGSRINPPFIHSSDALSSVAATLGKLGK